MIQYWSTWNFAWFLGNKMNYFKSTNALKTSIIITSLLGGSLVYIYPRKMIMQPIKNVKYKLSHWQMVLTDFVFHQIPMIYTLNNTIEDDDCGGYVLIPFAIWLNTNILMKTQMNRLYGINISKLIGSAMAILGTGGLIYHKYIPK